MVNINNKSWDKLRFSDIKKLLAGSDDETFFFEFKADGETPAKLIKEVSAFSNTFGGYILLGINDDKTIGGCTQWTEQRIHTTIHDSITPVPNFDVKKFKHQERVVFIIKIEEGAMPPYITNKGQIFERVSSGSFPIKDSAKLSQLYYKRADQLKRTENKIGLDVLPVDSNIPGNLCGYLDIGFSVVCSEKTELQKCFYKFNFKPIAEYIRSTKSPFSISQVGHSYLISIGRITATGHEGEEIFLKAGIQNFIEIMFDGSVRSRILLTSEPGSNLVDISNLVYVSDLYKKIYSMVLGERFAKIFVYAQKYERLTVVKQFVPYYNLQSNSTSAKSLREYLSRHQTAYGNNLIIESNRIPVNDYTIVDKRTMNESAVKYSTSNLIKELFLNRYVNLGYIDPLEVVDK